MAENEGLDGSGQTVKVLDAPGSFPSSESNDPSGGSTAPGMQGTAVGVSEAKKKRGRPRKYLADGGSVGTLSPTPISVSIPLSGEYPHWKQTSSQKNENFDLETAGGAVTAFSLGRTLIPHVVIVSPGEDVLQRIMSVAQQGSKAICILAANGSVSNVTLCQSSSSGGTMTYAGHFEIISLTGSFMPRDIGLTRTTSGGMSICLAGNDGRVLGGGLSGVLVAATPVQVVIASFPPLQPQQKPRKPKYKHTISFTANAAPREPVPGDGSQNQNHPPPILSGEPKESSQGL